MIHKLEELFYDRLTSGLRRTTIKTCSQWAENYRVMGGDIPGPFRFKYHPWCRAMHDTDAETVVGMKAAQMGYTEVALNKTFYTIDMLGKSVLYVLPAATPDASDFSTSRFDPALEMSKHINNLFSDVKNIGHKRAGNANLFVRGSRSRSQLKSLPVALAIADELDEMVQENVALIPERMSGHFEKQFFLISTPTIENLGIHRYFRDSTQDHFFFRCPMCGKLITLEYPRNIVITADNPQDQAILDSHLICHECEGVLEHNQKREWLKESNCQWVSSYSDRMTRGFHVNQMYSFTIKPYEFAMQALKAQTNATDEQEFFNSKIGLPHEVEGARVTDEDLEKCTQQGHKMTQGPAPEGSLVTMGVDVGKWIHVEISRWWLKGGVSTPDMNIMSMCQVLRATKVQHFEELDQLMKDYPVHFCVIDAQPERRKSLEFAQRFWGHVKICYYGAGISGKTVREHAEEEHAITVDRTSWLDMSLGRFRRKNIKLPYDIPHEYKEHIKTLVRIYEKDKEGNPVGRYVKGDHDPDHYAHARNYCELALVFAANYAVSHDIGDGV